MSVIVTARLPKGWTLAERQLRQPKPGDYFVKCYGWDSEPVVRQCATERCDHFALIVKRISDG